MKKKNYFGNLLKESKLIQAALRQNNYKLVLAESCTAGLVTASLGQIPGISKHLCGSLVVYRNSTKSAWLGITPALLKKYGPVSRKTSEILAHLALELTPEAELSAAVTGHLGPNAPKKLDGKIFVAIAMRHTKKLISQEFRLPQKRASTTLRLERQVLASLAVLFMVRSLLELNTSREKNKNGSRKNTKQ